MRVLVTGGAGFIGSHVVDGLIARGHRVAVIDDLSTGRTEFLGLGTEFLRTSVGSAETAAFVKEWKPDALAHLAARVSVRDSVDDPVLDAQTNVLGSIAILEACRIAGSTQVVFSSTGGAMYGYASSLPTPESVPPTPLSPYGCAKLSVEAYLGYFARVHGFRTCALRFANVYGPRQSSHGEAGVIAIFTERYLRGEQPTIHGDGSQTRDYIHVSDVAAATIHSLERGLAGVYNVGTGIETSTQAISDQIQRVVGAVCAARHGPAREGDALRSSLDSSALASAIGWSPRVDLASGLPSVVDWYRSTTPRSTSS